MQPRVSSAAELTTTSRQRRGELLEPELLDLALRVEPERALDANLDPQPLAVEAVLEALVEAAQRLVARKTSLSVRPQAVWIASFLFAVTGPSMNDHFGPPRLRSRSAAKVPSRSQQCEDGELERVRVWLGGQRFEHAPDSRREEAEPDARSTTSNPDKRPKG